MSSTPARISRIDRFIDVHSDASRLPPDRRGALRTMLGRWHWQSTTLEPVRQCGTDETGYAVLANTQTGELDSLHLTIAPGGSIVRQMRLVQGSTVPTSPADTSSDSARAVALGNLVRRMAKVGTFSGEVLLAHNGRIVYHEAAGVADRSTGRKAAVGDGYSIASVGKLITATAIMQLIEQGRLSLDDTLGKFLAVGDRPAGAARVPIKTILSHTDGMTNGCRPGTTSVSTAVGFVYR